MEIKDLLKVQLLKYLSKELSRELLYKWALDLLHNMLKGDIFKIQYLEIWGIITGLVEIEDVDDFLCEELIKHYLNILSGNENASFTFAMKIPKKFVVYDLSALKNILKRFTEDKHLLNSEIEELKLINEKKANRFDTLNDILEAQIVSILKLGYELEEDENIFKFCPKSTVFISEDMSLENSFLLKLITLLECYEGDRSFFVHISFVNGNSNISIQV